MSDSSLRPIIVKKIKKGGHGHHGGAWKIAYADFVTAMMAFFLLMWLLGSTTKATLKGISDYFSTPLKVSMMGGEGSGDATSVIPGGGEDLTRSIGQVKQGADDDQTKLEPDRTFEQSNPKEQVETEEGTPEDEVEKEADLKRLEAMKDKLEQAFSANAKIQPYKDQITIGITPEGLRIQVQDKQNRPMFEIGRASLQPFVSAILEAITDVLKNVPNRISISGYTDAIPYAAGALAAYSNWELSADRANSTRREMLRHGLKPEKIMRVVGFADSVPLLPNNPTAAQNRRISILVLNKETEENLMRESGMDVTQLTSKAQINSQINNSQTPEQSDTENPEPATDPDKQESHTEQPSVDQGFGLPEYKSSEADKSAEDDFGTPANATPKAETDNSHQDSGWGDEGWSQ